MRFELDGQGYLVPEVFLENPQDVYPINHFDILETPNLKPHYQYSTELQQSLFGKQLLLDELPFNINQIHEHYENGFIAYHKGVCKQNSKWKCARCGNQNQQMFATFHCHRCYNQCTYCRSCIMMGRVSSCTPLISWIGQPMPYIIGENPLQWDGVLSQGQANASDRVVLAIHSNQELLVWAVCGAGKTEVLFAGINEALSNGKRVCIATPRTDVVLELAPRLKKVFPKIEVAALYGGYSDKQLNAALTISTTHQLLRYYEAFDTVILDEVDAFPYSVDPTLQYAVQKARKPTSSMIYLTATPNKKWQQECRSGKRPYVTIPARYHRHPLPVPRFKWCGNWQKRIKKGHLPKYFLSWIEKRYESQKQILLFLPRIDLMDLAFKILQKNFHKIDSVHAEDHARKEKVQKMRDKETQILLTTTILERGVTFPNIDVAVLGAEDQIFTESALVQIAGRVGRSNQYPSGDIVFFHYGITKAMIEAQRQIVKMNIEARKKGLIYI